MSNKTKSNNKEDIQGPIHPTNTPEWRELVDEYAKGPEPHYMNTPEWRELIDKYSHSQDNI